MALRRTQVNVTRSQHEAMKKLADEKGISVSEYMRRIIDEHLASAPRTTAEHKNVIEQFIEKGKQK